MAKKKEDIPKRDDDFYTFNKDIVEVLEEVTEMGGITQENWKHWLIPEAKFKTLKEKFTAYEKLWLKAQKKKDRTASDVSKHRKARSKDLEPYLRKFIRQHIREEDQIPDGEKVRMAILPRDTEPSPVHGSHLNTLSPAVKMKHMGGSVIDLQYRRTADEDRPSVPKGYMCELSYQIGGTPPADPEDTAMANHISSKAHFQLKTGMSNLGKTLFGFARYRHKTDSTKDSPWTDLMQITIA